MDPESLEADLDSDSSAENIDPNSPFVKTRRTVEHYGANALSLVKGYAELLAKDPDLLHPEDLKNFTSRILEGAEQLDRLHKAVAELKGDETTKTERPGVVYYDLDEIVLGSKTAETDSGADFLTLQGTYRRYVHNREHMLSAEVDKLVDEPEETLPKEAQADAQALSRASDRLNKTTNTLSSISTDTLVADSAGVIFYNIDPLLPKEIAAHEEYSPPVSKLPSQTQILVNSYDHYLTNALVGVDGYADMLSDFSALSLEQRTIVGDIRQRVAELLAIQNFIFGTVKSGSKLVPHPDGYFDFDQEIEQLMAKLRPAPDKPT